MALVGYVVLYNQPLSIGKRATSTTFSSLEYPRTENVARRGNVFAIAAVTRYKQN